LAELHRNPEAARQLAVGLGLIAIGQMVAFALTSYWTNSIGLVPFGRLIVMLGLCYLVWRNHTSARVLLYFLLLIAALTLAPAIFRPTLAGSARAAIALIFVLYSAGALIVGIANRHIDAYAPGAPFGAK
jgi:hypothetical protein